MLVIESMCEIYLFLHVYVCVYVLLYIRDRVTYVMVQVAFCWSLSTFSTLGSGGLNSDHQAW